MESGLGFTRLDPDPGPDVRLVPLRRQLGVSTFGLNQIVLRPGQRMRIHTHERQEEVYLVLAGTLTLLADDGFERDLDPGELVRVAPGVRRQLVNRQPETLSLLALGGATPHEGRDGQAFTSWDGEPQPIADVPLPEDLPVD